MKATGRHAVTHIGRLRRSDGADFEGGDVLHLIETLDDLFSFAVGRVVSVILPVGWADGASVWAHWAAMRAVDVPLNAASWLDEQRTAAQIAELLTCGCSTYQDPLRRSVFKNALAYYLTANFDSPETMSTLLPVSGLQVLAYGHFVESLPAGNPAHISKSAWENLKAQDILRRLLALTTVDLSIPSHLARISTIQAKRTASALQNNQTPRPARSNRGDAKQRRPP